MRHHNSPDHETDRLSEAPKLERRGLIKSALACSAAAVIPALLSKPSEAEAGVAVPRHLRDSRPIRPGTFLKVRSATGVRAGSLTQAAPGQSVISSRKSFDTSQAYADAGYWFFFYELDGLLAAVRLFTTRSSGKQVCYSLMGQRVGEGVRMASSLGSLIFEPDQWSGQLQCRVMATNYNDLSEEMNMSGQASSPYFISTQSLTQSSPREIDPKFRDRINQVIRETASSLNFQPDHCVYCA